VQADGSFPWVPVAILGAAILIALIIVGRTRGNQQIGKLRRGVQFYPNPTGLEPPGTVFRIDANRTQYLVKQLTVPVQSAPEASGTSRETVTVSTGVVAQLFGIAVTTLKVGSERTAQIALEMGGVVREITFDADLDAAVDEFRREKYRVDNRYFIIRECWLAKSIDYRFTERYILDLGGEAVVKQINAKASLLTRERSGEYVLKRKFPTPLRVLFLPEEITPISAGLGGESPRLDRTPVDGPLVWEDRQE